MLTLLIFFCLIYVLVRLLGLYSEAVLLMLSGFLVLVSPITNTCVNAKHMHRDCFFSFRRLPSVHLPLSFFPLSFLCFLFFADALIFNTSGRPKLGERTCANLSCVILCHLASLCRLALMLFFWWCYVMVLILDIRVCHLCFLQQPWGLKTPQQSEDVGFVGEMDWGEKCAPHLW